MVAHTYWLWTMSHASMKSRSYLLSAPEVLSQHWMPSSQGMESQQPSWVTMARSMLVKKWVCRVLSIWVCTSPAVHTSLRVMGWLRDQSKRWRAYWRSPLTHTWLSSATEPLPCPGVTSELPMGRCLKTNIRQPRKAFTPEWLHLFGFHDKEWKKKQKSNYDKQHRVKNPNPLPYLNMAYCHNMLIHPFQLSLYLCIPLALLHSV